MVSTKLLPTLSLSTPKPKRGRSVPFGSTFAHAYGYEKLSSEYDMDMLDDVDVADDDDDSTVADSVFSVFFSVGDICMSSDECSYSYSLSSDPFHAKEPTRTPTKRYSITTIDTSDYSNCTFDLSYMSRHAGLDYNDRVPPKQKDDTSPIKADIPSRDDLPKKALSRNDEDVMEGARVIKEHLRAVSCHQQLEKTFDSDIIDEDEDMTISAKLLPGSISSVSDGRRGYCVGKWLRRRKSKSTRRHLLTSPAA